MTWKINDDVTCAIIGNYWLANNMIHHLWVGEVKITYLLFFLLGVIWWRFCHLKRCQYSMTRKMEIIMYFCSLAKDKG